MSLSPLQKYRLNYLPKLPAVLHHLTNLVPESKDAIANPNHSLNDLFPKTAQNKPLFFTKGERASIPPLKVGVVLSGGQAPGGHNVISGLFDALKQMNPESRLIGFLDGPSGIIKNLTLEITEECLASYRNQGGFDAIGSSRTKIETPDQFTAAAQTVLTLDLDGLVVIGGDDSNTNAAFLAEYFEKQGIKTRVIGVPKTIDGDLQNEWIEISFGFDTACKVYSEMVGNILKDNLSAKKSYYFIKLMGRSASHITLECALKTHPNLALISEEIAEKNLSLARVVDLIADLICQRAELGKNYGVILIPEGLIEFIPDFKEMIHELNLLLAADNTSYIAHMEGGQDHPSKMSEIVQFLTPQSASCFLSLPIEIQGQLLLDRDPHGNIQVSKIETERLLIALTREELNRRKLKGHYKGTFAPQPLFFGYEGRSALPSNFDCQYCYALGYVSALLISWGVTGYMSCISHLAKSVENWGISGLPLYSLLHEEWRSGKRKVVIRKQLVDLKGPAFHALTELRDPWRLEDDYSSPGPIQFEGPADIVESCPLILLKRNS